MSFKNAGMALLRIFGKTNRLTEAAKRSEIFFSKANSLSEKLDSYLDHGSNDLYLECRNLAFEVGVEFCLYKQVAMKPERVEVPAFIRDYSFLMYDFQIGRSSAEQV